MKENHICGPESYCDTECMGEAYTLHPVFEDILARFTQAPSMNTKNTSKPPPPTGNRHTHDGNRLCRVCGKGPVSEPRMTFNGEYGQFVHGRCFREWQKRQ